MKSLAEEIVDVVSDVTGTKGMLFTSSRKQGVVDARLILVRLLKENTTMSEVQIGEFMTKNHATVHYYLKAYQNRYDTCEGFRKLYDYCNGKVNELLNYTFEQ